MPSLTRRRVSASLLVLAAARVASGQSTSYVTGTPSATPAPANPYAGSQTFPTMAANLMNTPSGVASTGLALNGVLGNGGLVVTDTSGSTNLVYEYAANNSTPVLTGPTTGVFVSLAGVSNQTFKAANFGGSVVGQVARYVAGSNTSAGSDAYLYIPSVQASTGSAIIIGDQNVLGRVNTAQAIDGTIYYGYNTSSTVNGVVLYGVGRTIVPVSNVNGVTSAPTGINANSQVILTAVRTTGLTNASYGTDAFLFTPASDGSATGTPTLVGLSGSSGHYYYGTTVSQNPILASGYAAVYQTSNSTPVALNAGGAVVGTTTRYASNTTTSTYSATSIGLYTLGSDAWVYSGATALGTTGGATAVGTVQIGLVGTASPTGGIYSATSESGVVENSAVAGISAAGAVTGTSVVYSGNNTAAYPNAVAFTSLNIGTDAWQFTPSLTGGTTNATATTYGTTPGVGTYVRLGLTSVPTAGSTTVGYQSSTGARSSTVAATNAAGLVAGLSTRYFAGATSSSGSDAWYYNGSGSSYLITPATNPAYSVYVSSSNTSSSSLNATMSARGVVAGTQSRYATGTTTSLGADAFAYSPVTNNAYVIASPALIANDADFASNASAGSAAEYFSASVISVGDNGLVLGTFTAYNGSTTSAPSLGSYVYAWTQQAGTVVVGSTTNASSAIAALTLNSSSGTNNINVGNIYADAAGDIFGVGTQTGTTTPDVFEFAAATAAAPEPTSLALLGLALTPLLGGRRRRGAGSAPAVVTECGGRVVTG